MDSAIIRIAEPVIKTIIRDYNAIICNANTDRACARKRTHTRKQTQPRKCVYILDL